MPDLDRKCLRRSRPKIVAQDGDCAAIASSGVDVLTTVAHGDNEHVPLGEELVGEPLDSRVHRRARRGAGMP
jgi:hypothetical protein